MGGRGAVSYRRDAFTWAAFGALFAFGFLNALLGPALPYIRSVEGISYLVGALHQVAFAIGGGTAGVLSARVEFHSAAGPLSPPASSAPRWRPWLSAMARPRWSPSPPPC